MAKKSGSKPKAIVKPAAKAKRPAAKPVATKPVVKAAPVKTKAAPPAKAVSTKKITPPAKPIATKVVATKAAPVVASKSTPVVASKSAPAVASKNGKAAAVVVPAKAAAAGKGSKSKAAAVEAKDAPKSFARPGVVLLTMNPKAKNAIALKTDKPSKSSKDSGDSKKEKLSKKEEAPIRLPPPPVTSDSKMAKNRAGLNARELEVFRDLLINKRREILGDVTSMERDALRSGNTNLSTLPLHMADTGTDNYEQEFTLGLVEKDRQLLREIQSALAKIQDGSYGICEGTGKPIAKPRLEAKPWAKYSIEHARQLEKPQFRRTY